MDATYHNSAPAEVASLHIVNHELYRIGPGENSEQADAVYTQWIYSGYIGLDPALMDGLANQSSKRSVFIPGF